MISFDDQLNARLADLREQQLYRRLRRVDSPQQTQIRIDGKVLLNFASNDYLGLANHSNLKSAAAEGASHFGAGSGASRLICGSIAPHHELEETIAQFKQTPAALSFSSGYSAAIGTIGALAGRNDVVVIDKLVHASIVDAARLSRATLRVFHHNDPDDLEKILKWTRSKRDPSANVLIVTESIFSMDGDLAPLREIVRLKDDHGAWLMVDEAHATGIYGPNRRGLAEELGVADRIEVQMGTLGKAIGAAGGYICGSQTLIELLVNRARPFIFSTAPVAAASAAARAGIQLVQSREGAERLRALRERIREFKQKFGQTEPQIDGAIQPVIVGKESFALEISAALADRGIFVPAIRYPTVPRDAARLRITFTAEHTADDIDQLVSALVDLNVKARA